MKIILHATDSNADVVQELQSQLIGFALIIWQRGFIVLSVKDLLKKERT